MHSAHYDSFGNIILDDGERVSIRDSEETEVHVSSKHVDEPKKPHSTSWTAMHDAPARHSRIDRMEVPKTPPEQPRKLLQSQAPKKSAMKKLGEKTKDILTRGTNESASQLYATVSETGREFHSLMTACRAMPKRMHSALNSFLQSANAPIRIPSFMKQGKKPPTRLKLFLVDTVRFGGTFAGIFFVLFLGINAQSFFQIGKAELALGSDLHEQQGLEQIVSGKSGESQSPSDINATSSSDLLSFLPSVGPYENRLIIPKLAENVPIVRPSLQNLMQENWKKFEDDIQAALHDGVVHYPGSAKPGQAGNFFLTGHSSYYPWDDGKYKDVFARLKDLSPGDTYSVYYGGDKHTYRVTAKKEVKPSDVSVLDQPTNKRTATLMTCSPVGTTLRRLIVTADEIDPETGEALSVGEKVKDDLKTPTSRLESLPI